MRKLANFVMTSLSRKIHIIVLTANKDKFIDKYSAEDFESITAWCKLHFYFANDGLAEIVGSQYGNKEKIYSALNK